MLNAIRHQNIVQDHQSAMQLFQAGVVQLGPDEFPDDRLKLLFVCAHPAIDPALHTPLMLQMVLGLDAAAIAPAFLVSPATMAQRLVRATGVGHTLSGA